jgi:hypothetical protein
MSEQLNLSSVALTELNALHPLPATANLSHVYTATHGSLASTLASPNLLPKYSSTSTKSTLRRLVKECNTRHSVSGGSIDALFLIAADLHASLHPNPSLLIDPLLENHFRFLLAADCFDALSSPTNPFPVITPLTDHSTLQEIITSTISEATFSYQLHNPNATPLTVSFDEDSLHDVRLDPAILVAPSYLRYILNEIMKNCLYHATHMPPATVSLVNTAANGVCIKVVNKPAAPLPPSFNFGTGKIYDRLEHQQSYATPQSDPGGGLGVGIALSQRIAAVSACALHIEEIDGFVETSIVLDPAVSS